MATAAAAREMAGRAAALAATDGTALASMMSNSSGLVVMTERAKLSSTCTSATVVQPPAVVPLSHQLPHPRACSTMVLPLILRSLANMMWPPTPLPEKKMLRVAVVGGGVSGLTCAIALARHGIDVQVYEAAVSVPRASRAIADGHVL